VDIIIQILSLVPNSEISPFLAIVIWFMYNQRIESQKNKKIIEELQKEEVKRLKEELKSMQEEILKRAKQHNENNSNAVSQYIKELLKRLDNDKSK
jgi:SNF2 family DNA or RNA helicase